MIRLSLLSCTLSLSLAATLIACGGDDSQEGSPGSGSAGPSSWDPATPPPTDRAPGETAPPPPENRPASSDSASDHGELLYSKRWCGYTTCTTMLMRSTTRYVASRSTTPDEAARKLCYVIAGSHTSFANACGTAAGIAAGIFGSYAGWFVGTLREASSQGKCFGVQYTRYGRVVAWPVTLSASTNACD